MLNKKKTNNYQMFFPRLTLVSSVLSSTPTRDTPSTPTVWSSCTLASVGMRFLPTCSLSPRVPTRA